MRAVLVVNPQATATTPAGRDVLAHALASQVKLDIVETDYRGHAMAAAAQAALDNVDLVVAHGGDGTVNEVVNGMLSAGGHVPMLGVVPGGSANVFARSLGLPRHPVEATHILLRAIEEGRRREVGLGMVDIGAGQTRWFTFSAGMGWDAEVVADVDRKRGKKASPALYTRIAAARYLRPRHGKPDLTVHIPGEDPIEGLRLAFISNTDPWTYMGSRAIHLNHGTSFDTGLGLFALRTLRAPTVVRHVAQAFSGKGETKGKNLVRRDDVAKLVVTAANPVQLQCDGDLIGARTRVEFTSMPKALTVAI
ncbi:diacylglycerol kinase family protein [Alloactinosynnema sp. L-07]|uniref:diacylglycerol/lipid kinase family protein n=1 Tax=Alloactinosynnema sp. L-07 TaxID=1653480 RepID=UPI0006B435CC|nr:diacylglycerol kinase family protein [Alloactinosynnema sp. L-07]